MYKSTWLSRQKLKVVKKSSTGKPLANRWQTTGYLVIVFKLTDEHLFESIYQRFHKAFWQYLFLNKVSGIQNGPGKKLIYITTPKLENSALHSGVHHKYFENNSGISYWVIRLS